MPYQCTSHNMQITLLTDNPNSWIVPFIQKLRDALIVRGHRVAMCVRAQDISNGDIACFLSCERIMPKAILDRNAHNVVVHESALPHGKGFSPLTWQILEGKNEIPITLFEAVEDLDAGPIYFKETMRFAGHELIDELRAIQGEKTVELVLRFVDAYPDIHGIPQIGVATTYPRRRPKDSMLDPHKTLAEQFDALRVVDNDRYPAFFTLRDHVYELRIQKPASEQAVEASPFGVQRTATDPRVVAVLQARYSSSRLPGKVLKPILGEPMLARQIERIQRSNQIDRLIVATSTEASDNPIAELCERIGVPCSRGSLTDVLDRFYHAAASYHPTHVVRLTGDCPLIDPEVIDAVIDFAFKDDFDYATNAKPYTFPDGLDVEVVKFSAFEAAWREAELPSHREHVLPFVHRQPERFYLGYLQSPVDYSRHRWTVDEPEDFAFVTAVYEALYPTNPDFRMQDILGFLEGHPELLRMNERFERNAGRRKALEADAKFLASQRAPMSVP